MVANRRVTGRAMSIPGGLALGLAASTLLTVLGAAVVAWLVDRGTVPESGIGYGAMGILLLASWLGAVIAKKQIKHRQLLVCLLSGTVYFLALVSATALFFDGRYQGMGVTALVTLAGCGAAGLLGVEGRGGVKKRRRKAASR